jgi:hypothetical protein
MVMYISVSRSFPTRANRHSLIPHSFHLDNKSEDLPSGRCAGLPYGDPLAGRRRNELDQRRRSAPSHVYERTGPVHLRPVYRG